MARKLVIVESPAKAKTIGGFLGSDFEVHASIGHVQDLAPNKKGIPVEHQKKWWSDYAVDVENGFKAFYQIPAEKSAQVRKLKEALKGKDTLVLATDEDREGEAISWHLLDVLKPGKGVSVKRIAFHEITREAILQALEHPRDVDQNLVKAQEARRILDRLYGYTLSPVLWSRVTKNLSAGRVQSPAVKLIVEREMQRRQFKSASYWDLRAELSSAGIAFPAELRTIAGVRVATGSDFDDRTGELRTSRGEKVVLLNEQRAQQLAEAARHAKPWKVTGLDAHEAIEKPAAPFMTTTLQQDANRKFGFSADRTMRIAQSLYEGVDIGGEQVGLITYMRTDSLTLSKDALDRIRALVAKEYPDCLPDKPVQYTSKVKNAQEAHEAIRPTDASRRPDAISRHLNEDQRKLYTLIWQRAIASQMKPARVLRTEAEISVTAGGEALTFMSTGRQVLFDGFYRVYTEGRDEDPGEGRDRQLPRMEKGDELDLNKLEAVGHHTKPPARYTDATLIKKLEEQGIGRPSTYASIIGVIVDRGYVRKVGKQLVPTFKAFLAIEVLDSNFEELMDFGFTARMDEELDRISTGEENSERYLSEFFFGDGAKKGLKPMVDERKREIPYPAFVVGAHPESKEPIVVRIRQDGTPFLQMGEGTEKRYAAVPEDVAPGDLTLEAALALFEVRSAPSEAIGVHPQSGRKLLLKNRQGFYLEVERTPEEIERKDKPQWISVPPGVDPRELSPEDLGFLCTLPKEIGSDPATGQPILFKVGRFGAYLESGTERRTVEDWRSARTMSVEQAAEILKQPKYQRAKAAAVAPLKEFGALPGAQGPVRVLSGRYGPYVTDGQTNATLPRGSDPATLSEDQAIALLDAKRERGSAQRPARRGTTKRAVKRPARGSKKT